MNDEQKKGAFENYMKGATPNLMILDEVPPEKDGDGPGDAEFHISLTATASNQDQANRLFAKFSATALDVAHDSVSQMVSSHKFNDDDGFLEGEFYNEQTMLKVIGALEQVGISTDQDRNDVLNSLLNAGILFRERR